MEQAKEQENGYEKQAAEPSVHRPLKVLIPGSFDPITNGHLDVITRTASRFDQVYVAVMTNDMRKYDPNAKIKQYRFTQDERLEMVRLSCAHLPNVEVLQSGGMLIDLVDRLDVDWIIKGVRTSEDFIYEQKHALWNRAHNERAETLYLPADPRFDGLSSTLVRQKLEKGEPIDSDVPVPAAQWMEQHTRMV